MPGVLFLCVANSARSQMAEGLARADRLERFRSVRDAIARRLDALEPALQTDVPAAR